MRRLAITELHIPTEAVQLSKRVLEQSTNHYLRFSVENFLDDQIYENLRNSFPVEALAEQMGTQFSTVFSLSGTSDATKSFLAEHPLWDEYRLAFEHENFRKDAIATFHNEFCNRYSTLYRPFIRRRLRNHESYEPTVLLTLSRTGYVLSPHSDDKFKVLSLIHYFPQPLSTARESGGTIYYVPTNHVDGTKAIRTFSIWNRGLRRLVPRSLIPVFESSVERINKSSDSITQESLKIFNAGFRRDSYSQYIPNRMVGFIKSANSFHELNLTEFPLTEYRAAVVINLRLKETFFSLMSNKFTNIEIRLARLKHRITK